MNKEPRYYLDASSEEFVIEQYNLAKPFANFLPGIAGLFGIPMWVFYVNRGQAIISFGTQDKDHAILEFLPANKAYQLCALQGFRTFIKIKRKRDFIYYEPLQFNQFNLPYSTQQKIFVSAWGLRLEEINKRLGLKVEVEYFTIPGENFPALGRRLSIINLDKQKKNLEVLDGLPQIIPYGTANLFLKKLSRTVEAWMRVENLEKRAPFYRLTVDPTDRPEIVFIEGGNFYLNFSFQNSKAQMHPAIVDPEAIFNGVSDFCVPYKFFKQERFVYPSWQMTSSKTPSAFGYADFILGPAKREDIYSVIGKSDNLESLKSVVLKVTQAGYLAKKSQENKEIITKLQNNVFCASSLPELNLYIKQTYLDNVLRGGLPITIKTKEGPFIFSVYSRKHGDLERDYNKFLISPTYYSQGNGNYRDMCQNRRLDIWFNPQVKESTLVDFFNLIQADGYNPLVIKEDIFYSSSFSEKELQQFIPEKKIPLVLEFLAQPFKLGQFCLFLEKSKIRLRTSREEFLKFILGRCFQDKEVEHAEGFWTDHWTYNLDNLENFGLVYPERLLDLLFKEKKFTFFDNNHVVRARSERYVLHNGKPRQLHSVYGNHAKFEAIRKRQYLAHLMRLGKDIYKTTLLVKILCIIANKLATLDPFGIGIEMEADKPNWFDSLNGLPGLFGSSLCETIELKRWVKFVLEALECVALEKDFSIKVPDELFEFIRGLSALLKEDSKDSAADFLYWDKSNNLKEKYRQNTLFGFMAQEKEISLQEIKEFLRAADKKLSLGIEKAKTKEGLVCSYFINEVKEYEFIYDAEGRQKTNAHGEPYIRPLAFNQIRLPLFLEGIVHLLKIQDERKRCAKIYQAVRESRLFDKKLKMYKVTEPLASASIEIGRCRVFTPGWLENESVWLHMEYKYLLELLKKGLYQEFYQDFFKCLPLQDAQRYGRSILENCSFLVSSAFPDKNLHGNGFVARLSGSSIELLNMWLILNIGPKPFYLDEKGELNLRFSPILAAKLFSRQPLKTEYYDRNGQRQELLLPKNTYAFNFMSDTLVIYYNPKRKDTFGKAAAKIRKIELVSCTGKCLEIEGETIPPPLAQKVRAGEYSRIDIWLD